MIIDDTKAIKHLSTSDANVPWLVDRFEINFQEISVSDKMLFGKVFHYWESNTNYPVEGGINAVSIGDLMVWFGTALFPFLFLIIIVRLPINIYKQYRK